MDLENQVCSLELSKALKELGVKQESYFGWLHNKPLGKNIGITQNPFITDKYKQYKHSLTWSAFTVTELTEILPAILKYEGKEMFLNIERAANSLELDNNWIISYMRCGDDELPELFNDKKLVDALAQMLIYLIKEKLFEAKL